MDLYMLLQAMYFQIGEAMKCRNCGFENKESARFCGNCGFDLMNQNLERQQDQNRPLVKEPKRINKKMVIAISLLMIVAICIGGYFLYHSKKNNQIKALESALEVEQLDHNYKKMVEINQELYNLTKDEKYKKEIERINSLKANDDKSEKIRGLIDNEEFEEAYRLIKSMEKSPVKNQEEMDLLYSNFEAGLNARIDENDTYNNNEQSIMILNELLKIDPKNEYFKGLLDNVNRSEKEYQKMLADEEKREKEEARKENDSKLVYQPPLSVKADDFGEDENMFFVGNTGIIDVEKAYLYQAPGWNNKKVGYWIQNDEVTFYDVRFVDGTYWVNTNAEKNWWVPSDNIAPVDQN